MTEPMTMTAEEAREQADIYDMMTGPSERHCKALAATLRAYADMLERGASVRVKPLFWVEGEAATPFGSYTRTHCRGGFALYEPDGKRVRHENGNPRIFTSLDILTSVAQEHYEAAILAAIEAERPDTREERVNVQTVAAYEAGFDDGLLAMRERLAKAAEVIAAMEPESRPVWLTHAEWREVADWIRSQKTENG